MAGQADAAAVQALAGNPDLAAFAAQAAQQAFQAQVPPDFGQWQAGFLNASLAVKKDAYDRLDNLGTSPDGEMTVWEHRQVLQTYSERQLQTEQTVLLRLSLAKLRQIEKATYNAEARSDTASGLPSDMDRHVESARAQMATARQTRDEPAQAAIQAAFQVQRRDWLYTAAGQSCFNWLQTVWRCPRKL